MKTLMIAMMLTLAAGCASLGLVTQESRQQYVDAHPNEKDYINRAILEGRYVMGMTEREVVAAIGRPRDINRTVGSWGNRAQFVYGSCTQYGCDREYLYFENHKLTSWSR